MNGIIDGEPDIIGFIIVLGITIALVLIPSFVSAGNVSIYSTGSDFIIWSVSGDNKNISVDGQPVYVTGIFYGQYDISPNTVHFACDSDGVCIQHTTSHDGISVIKYWSVFFVLVALCIASYFVAISYAFQLIYGIYLIRNYLPSINAPFEQMILAVVLMVMGIISAGIGMRKRKGA